ncbi:MAG: SDR family NAD(P)-dependent oxidoreductase [bacterium]|nr:SDR family NAD(P)-dependent oxidoreductase [bacterium]
MKDFTGKVAVITGGASGIGKAIARALLGAGAKVVIADVEQAALDATTAELGEGGGEISGVVVDVRDGASVNALADEVFDRHGACHLLFNNAGVGVPFINLWETEATDWEWLIGVNLLGVTHGIRAFVPRMIASGEEGVVVNTSSGNGGVTPMAKQSIYAASKAGVSILTECLAAELRDENTNVSAAILYPSGGLLNTGLLTGSRNRPPELAREAALPEAEPASFEAFASDLNERMGFELPVQDLDELAQHALDGIRNQDFVIMIGREATLEANLTDRAKKLGGGDCPI